MSNNYHNLISLNSHDSPFLFKKLRTDFVKNAIKRDKAELAQDLASVSILFKT